MRRFIRVAFSLVLTVQCFAAAAQTNISSQLKEGDIVLQKIPCGGLCDAIIETTPCEANRMFNHCGIVHFENGKPFVIEAIGKAVSQRSLDSFLLRDNSPILYVARPAAKYNKFIEPAVKKAIMYIGTPYDDAFLPGDDALYCSELVWKVYKTDNTPPLFSLEPMTFKSRSGKTFPAWIDYYKEIKQEIPEGQLGINPCAIANADVVTLLSIQR